MKIGITERGDAGLDLSWVDRQDEVDGIILISKNPDGIPVDKIRIPFIIHCTITGNGGTIFEPNVPCSVGTLNVYNNLINRFGGDKIVLRVDPIIMEHKDNSIDIIRQRKGRLRISFLDKYRHAISRMKGAGAVIDYDGPFHYPLSDRIEFINEYCPDAEVCGEPDIQCCGCVSAKDLEVMSLNSNNHKEGFQRRTCHCLAMKTELLTHRKICPHGCLYCYWK